MKVLVMSTACGDGSPDEVRMALRAVGFVAKEMDESGATPHLFEIPDNSSSFRVMVVGEVPAGTPVWYEEEGR